MKVKILLSILISTTSSSAFGLDCGYFKVMMDNVQKQFNLIDYNGAYAQDRAKRKEVNASASMAISRAIDDFGKIDSRRSCREDAWRALLGTVMATAPYDNDSTGSNFVAASLKDEKLKTIYLNTIANTGEACRRNYVAAIVKEYECFKENATNPKAAEICSLPGKDAKNLYDCLRTPARKAEKSGASDDTPHNSAITSACLCGGTSSLGG